MEPVAVPVYLGELVAFAFLLMLALATSTKGQTIGLFVAIFAALDRAPQGVVIGILLAYAFGREKGRNGPA